MKLAALALIGGIAFAPVARAAPEESVKFVPTVKLYECPPDFVYRSDCTAHEKVLDSQKLVLNLEVLNQRMGQWNLQLKDPVAAAYHVIVVRGRTGKIYEYSVSTEAGLVGSSTPLANGRAEFTEDKIPRSFGISSSSIQKDGKFYLAEIRLTDFHGKPSPARK